MTPAGERDIRCYNVLADLRYFADLFDGSSVATLSPSRYRTLYTESSSIAEMSEQSMIDEYDDKLHV